MYIALALTMLCGCDGYGKMVKSTDSEAKYQAAVKYFEDGEWGRSKQLLEQLQLSSRNRDKSENIAWMLAVSQQKLKEYYIAAYSYTAFVRRYPYSIHAEEALYNAAYCKYLESPDYTLDQTLSTEAIEDLEKFAETYPNSTHIPEVNMFLDELREKLMLKDYEIAYGYYRIEQYHAAYVSLKNFINMYPDSPKKEEAMFYVIKSGYEYGANSREDKMKERLTQVLNDFDKFATLFQNSKYLKESQNIYTKCQALIAKIDNNNK